MELTKLTQETARYYLYLTVFRYINHEITYDSCLMYMQVVVQYIFVRKNGVLRTEGRHSRNS